jgi:hypothetical protein
MRRERPATKIIAISGGGRIVDPNFLEIAHQFGADGTLAKPFEPEQYSLLCDRCSMKNRRPYCIIASNYDPTREYPCILWAGSGLHAISQSVVQNPEYGRHRCRRFRRTAGRNATPVNDIGERQEKRGIRMVWRIGVSEARLRDAPERVGQKGEDIGRYQDRQLFDPDRDGMSVDVAQAQKHDPPTKGLPGPQGLRGDPGPERRHGLARASVPLRARP